jgi:hypothetical protein
VDFFSARPIKIKEVKKNVEEQSSKTTHHRAIARSYGAMELELNEAEVRYKKLKLERAKLAYSWQWVQQDNRQICI